MVADVCLDANVFVAALTPEAQRDPCLELLRRLEIQQTHFIEPALLLFEVTSTLRRKVVAGEVRDDHLHRALDYILQLPMALKWQTFLLDNAADYARALDLNDVYDTVYIAAAEEGKAPLITLDGTLQKRGRAIYPPIYSVDEYLLRL